MVTGGLTGVGSEFTNFGTGVESESANRTRATSNTEAGAFTNRPEAGDKYVFQQVFEKKYLWIRFSYKTFKSAEERNIRMFASYCRSLITPILCRYQIQMLD